MQTCSWWSNIAGARSPGPRCHNQWSRPPVCSLWRSPRCSRHPSAPSPRLWRDWYWAATPRSRLEVFGLVSCIDFPGMGDYRSPDYMRVLISPDASLPRYPARGSTMIGRSSHPPPTSWSWSSRPRRCRATCCGRSPAPGPSSPAPSTPPGSTSGRFWSMTTFYKGCTIDC